jgi:hypothetical protein
MSLDAGVQKQRNLPFMKIGIIEYCSIKAVPLSFRGLHTYIIWGAGSRDESRFWPRVLDCYSTKSSVANALITERSGLSHWNC